MAKKIIKSYYLFNFISHLSVGFFFTTYVLFLKEKAGLNEMQINIINSVFFFSVFLFEVPTGSVADILGRKRSLLISLLLSAVGFMVYFLSRNFWVFILAEITVALGMTFSSGAFDAWLVDSLNYYGHPEKENNKIFSIGLAVSQVGTVFGGLSGAYLGEINLAYPWLLSSLGHLILFFVAKKILDESYFKKLGNFTLKNYLLSTKQTVKAGFSEILSNKNLVLMTFINMIVFFSFQPYNMFWTLRFSKDLTVSQLGHVWVLISVSIILGLLIFSRVKNANLIARLHIPLTLAVLFVSYLLINVFYKDFYFLLVFFLLHEIVRAGFRPLQKTYLNKRIKTKNRATSLSVVSMFSCLGATSGLIFSGLFATYIEIPKKIINFFDFLYLNLTQVASIQNAWLLTGLTVIIAFVLSIYLNGEK